MIKRIDDLSQFKFWNFSSKFLEYIPKLRYFLNKRLLWSMEDTLKNILVINVQLHLLFTTQI